jgi:major capsid protein
MASPATMSPSRLGQFDGTGDTDAGFLKVFAGEVLTAFDTRTVAMSRQMIRSIASGKSASFPATWKGTAGYHTPGVQLQGTGIKANERLVIIDDLLVADRFIANIDEAKLHYEVRSIYSHDIGQALAQAFDKNSLQVMALAARAAATVDGGNGGTVVAGLPALTSITGADFEEAVFDAVQALDEKDVPEEDRFVYCSPRIYWALLAGAPNSALINRDFNPNPQGGYSAGVVKQIAGCELVKTNNLPRTNVTTGPDAYQGDFRQTVGLVQHRSSIGTVKLIDLATEMDYLIEYQGTLMVGKYACGHGILRPESAVELSSWAVSTSGVSGDVIS